MGWGPEKGEKWAGLVFDVMLKRKDSYFSRYWGFHIGVWKRCHSGIVECSMEGYMVNGRRSRIGNGRW